MVLSNVSFEKDLTYRYTNIPIYHNTDKIPILIIQTDRQHRAIDLAGFAASVLLPHGSSHVQEAANARKVLQTLKPCDQPTFLQFSDNESKQREEIASCLQVHSRRGGCGGDQVHSGERKYEAGLLFLPSA